MEKLRLSNPPAFSIGLRIRSYVRHIASKLDLPNAGEFELAAMLSQIGCLTMPSEIVEKVDAGIPLTKEEQKQFSKHTEIGANLIRDIPDLGNIAGMIGAQHKPLSRSSTGNNLKAEDRIALGSYLLKVSLDLDQLLAHDLPLKCVLMRLRRYVGVYLPEAIDALEDLEVQENLRQKREVVKDVSVSELDTRMVFDEDVFTKDGKLLFPKGATVTYPVLGELRTSAKGIGVVEPLRVIIQPHAS
ncbi:HD domain-containing phosphohydrolase [Candidatus Neomarinimicrobiota bacterium]